MGLDGDQLVAITLLVVSICPTVCYLYARFEGEPEDEATALAAGIFCILTYAAGLIWGIGLSVHWALS